MSAADIYRDAVIALGVIGFAVYLWIPSTKCRDGPIRLARSGDCTLPDQERMEHEL